MRHHAAGHHVALEHIGVTTQRGHTFLNTGTARIIQPNDGRADLHGLVHHFANFLGVRFAQGTTKYSEVLAKNKDQTAIDHAVAGDHAIARDLVFFHAEVHAAVLHKHVPLFKRAFVKQQLQTLAGREFAFFVLRVDAFLATAQTRELALGFKLFKDVLHGFFFLKSSDSVLF